MPHPRRFAALTTCLLSLGLALGLSGCSTGPTGGDSGDTGQRIVAKPEPGAYPVTIKDAYGSVTLHEQPRRVVTLGWSDQDDVLALGVVPVGATKITWGGNEHGSTPWFDHRLHQLGGTAPVRYDDSDGVPLDEIAELRPDLILATSSGITRSDYTRLSKLAPVVAFPGRAWETTWQQSLRMVGRALGLPGRAARLEDKTRERIAATADRFPELDDTTFVFTSLTATDLSKIDYYTAADNRSRLLTELGMQVAPAVTRLSRGNHGFYGTVSAERAADLRADVVITYVEKKGDLAKFEANPLISQIPAFGTGAVVGASDKTAALGLSAPSPLSIPYALRHFVPKVAAAAQRAEHHADTSAAGPAA